MSGDLSIYIRRCREGDREAFRHIVHGCHRMVYTLAFRLLCNRADAEDAAQEVFVRVWLNIGRYDERYMFSTWVCRITANICYDHMRRARKMRSESITDHDLCDFSAEADQAEGPDTAELERLLSKTTEGLSPKQRLVFTLSELEGMNNGEIAEITGMSPARIKSNLYLARKHIKLKLKKHE